MTFDNILIQLQKKITAKGQLEAKLRELHEQRRKYESDVISLRVVHRDEQEDVQKLEGRSLANYFYNVIGRLDEKLDKERQEAYAAKVKLDAAERELTQNVHDYWIWKTEGDYHGATSKIQDHWYYFDSSF